MTKNFILYLGLVSIGFTACDYVENPYPETTGTNDDCDTTFNFTTIPSNQRKVLLEEFTGHKCPNCPAGAAVIDNIESQWGDRFIPVAVHPNPDEADGMSGFTGENPSGSGSFETVWYFENSGEILNFLDTYPGLGLPTGAINREEAYGGPYRYFSYGDWSQEVSNYLNAPTTSDVGINLSGEFLPDGSICGKSEVHVFNTRTDTLRIVHYLVQDSIVDWQVDGQTNIPDYTHKHVLRGISGGDIYGQIVSYPSASGVISQHTFSFDVSQYTADDHLYLVAYVYSEATKVVLQAEEIHLEH